MQLVHCGRPGVAAQLARICVHIAESKLPAACPSRAAPGGRCLHRLHCNLERAVAKEERHAVRLIVMQARWPCLATHDLVVARRLHAACGRVSDRPLHLCVYMVAAICGSRGAKRARLSLSLQHSLKRRARLVQTRTLNDAAQTASKRHTRRIARSAELRAAPFQPEVIGEVIHATKLREAVKLRWFVRRKADPRR